MKEYSEAVYSQALDNAYFQMQRGGEAAIPGLRGHIFKEHIADSEILSIFGVARFDIDLARRLNAPLGWVVKKAINLLESDWLPQDKAPRLSDSVYGKLGLPWTREWSELMVAKNLKYIEQTGDEQIDWDRVEAVVPGARFLVVNLDLDSSDRKSLLMSQNPGPDGVFQIPVDPAPFEL
ncbi:MAG TPA: hypothetical protein VLE91_01995 [Candidatus Saccharimonadales bacterium]|nr:hypothetical protein [Candidatus Saccharimonadales bacterium]